MPSLHLHSISFPTPDPLFEFFLIGFFLFHAVFMNLLLGGVPVLLAAEIIQWIDPSPQVARFVRVFADGLPMAFIVAVVLGIGPLMGVQILYGEVFNRAAGIIGNLWVGVGIGLLMGYGGLHANKWWRDRLMEVPGGFLFTGVASALGFLGTAFVFVVLNVLMLHPDRWDEARELGIGVFVAFPTIWPRFLHLVLAAVAGTGMIIALYGVYLRSRWNRPWVSHRVGEDEYGIWVTRFGVIWVLIGTLPQILIGPWLLLALPDAVRHHLIAGETFGSFAFFMALTSALLGLVLLNAALMVPSTRGFTVAGVMNLIITMGLMVVVRETVRLASLLPYMEGSRMRLELTWVTILAVTVALIIAAVFFWRRLWSAGMFTRMADVQPPS